MAILTSAFTAVHHAEFPFICGSGSLLHGHTLILVIAANNDYRRLTLSIDLNSEPLILDILTHSGDFAEPSVSLNILSYTNTTGSSIDLTDAINISYGSAGEIMPVSVRAFTADGVLVKQNSQSWSSDTVGNPNITGYASTINHIDIGAITTYEEPVNWSWVNSTSNYQNVYGVIGDGVAAGSTAELSSGVFDYVGVADEGGGVTTLALQGTTSGSDVASAIVSYKETIIKYGTIGTMPMLIELATRPSILPPPALLIDQQFIQPYYLSLLETTFAQPYSQTIERDWTQTYGELQSVANEVVDAPYKLGFDDVAAQITQTYSGYLEFDIDQPYTQLQPVAKELNAPYKLGFDEVSGQVVQPYTLFIEAEFVQVYGDVIVATVEINQPYITSIPVEAEIVSTYDFIAGNFVSMNLTSHYTMYSSDNVVVINTSSGLVYKSGYTAQPVE